MTEQEKLKQIAAKLIWWQPPEVSVLDVRRLVAQVMDRGSWEDVKFIQEHLGVAAFRDALEHAEPGWFERASWALWHNAFTLPVPELPRRRCLEGAIPLNWRGR
jgi:hypothetical protein